MFWIVDNANALYVLLGVIAAGLIAMWWLNKRAKFLGYAAGVVALIGLIWLMTQFGTSDALQLKKNVNAMADAVVAGNVDELFKHISKDFNYKGMTRDLLYEATRKSIQKNQVKEVGISALRIDDVSRSQKSAKTRFRVSASGSGGDQPYIFVTQADFVLEDEVWKLKTMRFYNPLVNQDQEIDLPGIR